MAAAKKKLVVVSMSPLHAVATQIRTALTNVATTATIKTVEIATVSGSFSAFFHIFVVVVLLAAAKFHVN